MTMLGLTACVSSNIDIAKEQFAITEITVSNPNESFFDVKGRMEFLRNRKKSEIDFLMQASYFPLNLKHNINEHGCSPQNRPAPVGYLNIRQLGLYYGREDIQRYLKQVEPLDHFKHTISYLAALYVSTEDVLHAECILKILNEWAENESLLHYHYSEENKQAAFDVVWTACSAALTYSIIRSIPTLNQEYRDGVEQEQWLREICHKVFSHQYGLISSRNNHLYWRGLLATIVGVVSNDNKLFRKGVGIYVHAMKAMNRYGAWPLEMQRGERAIYYQDFAILPLVFIAEIANRQGYNLYDISIDGKDIHLAVKFLTNYLTYFKKPNGKKFMQHQFLDFFSKGYHLGWVEPYYNRFDKTDEFYRKVQWHKATYDKYGCGFTSLYFRKFSP